MTTGKTITLSMLDSEFEALAEFVKGFKASEYKTMSKHEVEKLSDAITQLSIDLALNGYRTV